AQLVLQNNVVFYNRHKDMTPAAPNELTPARVVQLSTAKKIRERGLTFVEIAVSVALLGVVFATVLGTLVVLNRNATSTRLMTNAREIVQRNIETAMGVPFSTSNIPSILAITTTSGQSWDEGTGNNQITVYTSRDGTMKVYGTLTRIVTTEANSLGADIRRVTFRLNYTLFNRNLSCELTTIRSKDQ